MLHVLKRHPLAMVAHFRRVLALTYAFDPASLAPLVPAGLELDTWEGNAFAAVAVVEAERLRPARAPRALGRDAFMAGYRVFVRRGSALRGLRIVRSETDSRALATLGNRFTRYGWTHVPVSVRGDDETYSVTTPTLELSASLALGALPPASPFADAADARRFAGPMPYTFEYERETRSLIAVRGVRDAWEPQLVDVDVRRCDFCAGGRLASAFHVADVDYRWNRGVRSPA